MKELFKFKGLTLGVVPALLFGIGYDNSKTILIALGFILIEIEFAKSSNRF